MKVHREVFGTQERRCAFARSHFWGFKPSPITCDKKSIFHRQSKSEFFMRRMPFLRFPFLRPSTRRGAGNQTTQGKLVPALRRSFTSPREQVERFLLALRGAYTLANRATRHEAPSAPTNVSSTFPRLPTRDSGCLRRLSANPSALLSLPHANAALERRLAATYDGRDGQGRDDRLARPERPHEHVHGSGLYAPQARAIPRTTQLHPHLVLPPLPFLRRQQPRGHGSHLGALAHPLRLPLLRARRGGRRERRR